MRRLTPYPILEIASASAASRGIKMHDWLQISTTGGAFISRRKLDDSLVHDVVFAPHGLTVSNTGDSPTRKGGPIVAHMNQAISTDECDPISRMLPLSCSCCQVQKL